MVYMGGKQRTGKDIAGIINREIKLNGIKVYLEPFCGGCNVIEHVECERRIGSDANEWLIELVSNMDKVEGMPDHIDKEHYEEVKASFKAGDERFEKWYKGAVGFFSGYRGRFYDSGYSHGRERDYYNERKRAFLRQLKGLGGVEFICCDYRDWTGKFEGGLIYCDPPYANTKEYFEDGFKSTEFWDWVREESKRNIVLVSEENAPEDFELLWQKECTRTMKSNGNTKSAIEKLFVIQRTESNAVDLI
jgi:DNA adenine methylase